MKILIFNSSHVVSGSNNSKYQIRLTNATLSEGSKIALHSIVMPYSWYNISASYNNNYLQYSINNVAYTVNLGDNTYLSVDDIANIIHIHMRSQGFYLVDSAGNDWYPINLSINSSRYGVQLEISTIPLTLQDGYTNPANIFYNTLVGQITAALIIPPTNIGEIFGLNAGTYTQAIKLSDFTPNAHPVNMVIVRCNACSNPFSIPSDMLYSFTATGTGFGNNIVEKANSLAWCDTKNGSVQEITLEFVDQNFRPIFAQDKNVCIQLLIKEKGE